MIKKKTKFNTFQEKIQNAKETEELKESYASKISDLDAKLASFGNAKQAEALMNQIAALNAQLKDRALQINQLEEKVMNPYFQFLYIFCIQNQKFLYCDL